MPLNPVDHVTATISRVLAPNPGPMTLDGTNTWIIHDDGTALVVDPGPSMTSHLEELVTIVANGSFRDIRVLVTHAHLDHSELVPEFLGRVPATLVSMGHEERLAFGDVQVEAVATPGHTGDSMSFFLTSPDQPAYLLSGDTVLGRGTTVIAHPDGVLADYLTSLHELRRRAAAEQGAVVLPGHGPILGDADTALDHYLRHRHERLNQIRDALAGGAETVEDVVRIVYSEVGEPLRPAAARSVAAQLEYLRRDGISRLGGD